MKNLTHEASFECLELCHQAFNAPTLSEIQKIAKALLDRWQAGDIFGCYYLGYLLRNFSEMEREICIPIDLVPSRDHYYFLALHEFVRLANAGDGVAAHCAASYYRDGTHPVEIDEETFWRYIKRGAECGEIESQRLLAEGVVPGRPSWRFPKSPLTAEGERYSSAMSLLDEMTLLGTRAKEASRGLARLTTEEKNRCLLRMADALEGARDSIRRENEKDMQAGAESGLSAAMLDRLRLDEKRIASMAKGLREVAALPDPIGKTLDERTRPNGLRLQKITTPIGVVVIIYESRPNVTADAASLCFKSGNATILRGGKEAIHSNRVIGEVMVAAGRQALPSFPEHAIQVVTTTDREAIKELLSLTHLIDLCMPRGGEGLIRAVTECSKVPVIKHYKGVCHVYVDADADLGMASEIVMNAKVQRPAVCNAMETLLVDRAIANDFLPKIAARLGEKNVEFHTDDASGALLRSQSGLRVKPATEQDWTTEYNDYVINVRILDGVQSAIDHINKYGSSHSDSIITRDETKARQFLAQVDSATVYWNASTRFTDGGEFGMGAEIGISTDKVGARGPMGLDELTTYKWLGFGAGQVRT